MSIVICSNLVARSECVTLVLLIYYHRIPAWQAGMRAAASVIVMLMIFRFRFVKLSQEVRGTGGWVCRRWRRHHFWHGVRHQLSQHTGTRRQRNSDSQVCTTMKMSRVPTAHSLSRSAIHQPIVWYVSHYDQTFLLHSICAGIIEVIHWPVKQLRFTLQLISYCI